MSEQSKNVISIDGKDYDIEELPLDLRNTIAARQEIQQSRVRHEIELEKIEVLTKHYNSKIQEGVKQFNGGNSKS